MIAKNAVQFTAEGYAEQEYYTHYQVDTGNITLHRPNSIGM